MAQNSWFFTGTVKGTQVRGGKYFFRFNGDLMVNDSSAKKQIVAQNEKCNLLAIPEDQWFCSIDQVALSAFIDRHSHEKLKIVVTEPYRVCPFKSKCWRILSVELIYG